MGRVCPTVSLGFFFRGLRPPCVGTAHSPTHRLPYTAMKFKATLSDRAFTELEKGKGQ